MAKEIAKPSNAKAPAQSAPAKPAAAPVKGKRAKEKASAVAPTNLPIDLAARLAAGVRVGEARRRLRCERFEVGELFGWWRTGGAHGVSRGVGG